MFEIIISIILAVMAIMLFLQNVAARIQSERIKLLEDIWLPEEEAEEYDERLCVYHDAVYCDNCGIGNGYGRCGYGGGEDE